MRWSSCLSSTLAVLFLTVVAGGSGAAGGRIRPGPATPRILLAIIHAACIHLIDIVLVASYLLSSTPPASSPPSSSTSYSSRRPCESRANNSRSSSTVSPRLICYRPCRHPHRHPHRHRTRRVLFAIIHAAGIHTSIPIDIVLVASYLLSSTLLASSPPSSSTSYSSRRIVQPPTVCPSESCANNLTKLVGLLAASYLLSSLPPA